MADNPEGVVDAFFRAVGEREVEAAAAFLDAAASFHLPAADGTSVEPARSFVEGLTTAFPDLRVELRNSFTTGDTVIVELTMDGTQAADHRGIAAQGKQFSADQAWLVEVVDGRITKASAFWCQNVLYRQLGAPAPARARISAA